MANLTPNKQLFDLLLSKGFEPQLLNVEGKPAENPSEAEVFSFDFESTTGNDYGTVVVMFDTDNNVEVYFGDNVGSGMESADKEEWFDFLYQIRMFARRNLLSFGVKNLNRLKYSMQGQAALKESWSGTKNTSFNGKPDSVRLMIKHNKDIGEGEQRFRHISKLFVETSDGERFLLPFTRLAGGRAMAQHIRQGGRPYDAAGQHIIEIVNELNVLSHYRRSQRGKVLEGDQALIMDDVNAYYENLQQSLKGISTNRGYSSYFESWSPATITEHSAMIECLRTVLTNEGADESIDDILPIIARATQEKTMKETQIFEQWAETLSEGTWSTPDTPEKQSILVDLLSRELPCGADGTNATEQLYDLIGDDVLFDHIQDLAAKDPDADCRPIVIARLQELQNIPDIKKVLDQINVEADTVLEPSDPGKGVEPAGEITEGINEVDAILQDIARGDREVEDVMNSPTTPEERYAASELQKMYDETVIDTGLHADDDFEKIHSRMIDQLARKYGIEECSMCEDAEFGSIYAEELAQKVFDKYPDLSTSGSADELLDAGWKIAAQDIGVKQARHMFNYDEDFASDLVSSYAYLQGTAGEEVSETKEDQLKYLYSINHLIDEGKITMNQWCDMIETHHLNGNKLLRESVNKNVIHQIIGLKNEYGTDYEIGKKYIPITISVFGDKISVNDSLGNNPPKVFKFCKLLSSSNDVLTFDVDGRKMSYPDKRLSRVGLMTVIPLNSKEDYDQLRLALVMISDNKLPDVDDREVEEGYREIRPIDRERYTDLSDEGLEGPFNFDGRALYYDPREGKYYDRDRDMYLDSEEADLLRSVNETTGVTDYNPKSQGGTRRELLAKYAKSKSSADAEAARRAGATQSELRAAREETNESTKSADDELQQLKNRLNAFTSNAPLRDKVKTRDRIRELEKSQEKKTLKEGAQTLAYPHDAQQEDGYVRVEGLDGPYRYPNGVILYFNRKTGEYFDPEARRYLSPEEQQNLLVNMNDRPGEYEHRGEAVAEDGYDETLSQILNRAGVNDEPRTAPEYDQSVTEADDGLADLTKIATPRLTELYSIMKYHAEQGGRDNPRLIAAVKRGYEELRSRGLNIPEPDLAVSECCDADAATTVTVSAPQAELPASDIQSMKTYQLRDLLKTIDPNTQNPAELELGDSVARELWRRGDHSPNLDGSGYDDEMVTLTIPADQLARFRDLLSPSTETQVSEIAPAGWDTPADSRPESTDGITEAPDTDIIARLRRLSGQK